MLQTIKARINGITPLLMHSARGSDPLDRDTQEMKKITGKRKKTEEDQIAISEMEFKIGIYVNERGVPVLPGENIEGALIDGAKKNKLGKTFKAAVICDGSWPVLYDGPKSADGLWKDKRFVDRRRAGIMGSAIMRTRPIFRQWAVDFELCFDDQQVSLDEVRQAMVVAGRQCGVGDFRPKFGRFEVESFEMV